MVMMMVVVDPLVWLEISQFLKWLQMQRMIWSLTGCFNCQSSHGDNDDDDGDNDYDDDDDD